MKALPFKIPKVGDHSFRIQHDVEPHFYDTLHLHPETQITLIEESTGTLILGDYLGEFKPGDLIVVGANIPHVLRNDDSYYKSEVKGAARAISLFFDENSFGQTFFDLPELADVKNLLKDARRGLRVVGDHRDEIKSLIEQIDSKQGIRRLIDLLQILQLLSREGQTVFLSSGAVNGEVGEPEGQRLNNIFQFTMKEYQRHISLDEVASVANMTVSAFCRYFKQRTRKTYINFLNEVRIGQACKLLLNEEHSVGEVCYLVGFNNLSHFNRQFKNITGYSPKAYVQNMRIG